MSRTRSVHNDVYNRALDLAAKVGPGGMLPTETSLASTLGASRTTIRAVLTRLDAAGIVRWNGRQKHVLRRPEPSEYYAVDETLSAGERLETLFMEYVLGGDLKPGSILRESELAREFGVSTSSIREYLIRFSRFGLIAKKPNRHWILKGFTREFAEELFDLRETFELRAFDRLAAEGLDAPTRERLRVLQSRHKTMCENIDRRYLKFPRLDEAFHRLFVERLANRFVDDFYEIVAMIFHFHYRWRKSEEKERNLRAAQEHLKVIDALLEDDFVKAREHYTTHLGQARQTLLTSVNWESDPDH